MADTYLKDPCGLIGPLRRSVEDAEAAGDLLSTSQALRRAGFAFHGICTPEQDAYDLAHSLLTNCDLIPDQVDCIIYANCLPQNANLGSDRQFSATRDVKHLMDFPASRLQADFGMQRAFVVGLNQQACTGMFGSIRLANALLCSEPDLQKILCITADRFPRGSRYEQSFNLISDGAALCTVGRQAGGFRLLACHQITNGALGCASDNEIVGSYFNCLHELITQTLVKARLGPQQIQWVVLQNTNVQAWTVLASLLGLPTEIGVCDSMAECGHVISADNMLNLAALERSGDLVAGDRVLTFMAGYGSNWQCIILERV